MKDNVWAKTVLTVYRYLERVCGAIDKLVESKAMSSFYVCSNNFYNTNVSNIADKLINLIERKKTLINLKVLVCDALKKCDKLSAQILIEKYIDGDKQNKIADRHNISLRNYFRKIVTAENNFTLQLSRLGFPEEKLASFLSGERWILDVYSRFSSVSRENLFEINEKRLNKLVLS